MDPLCEKYYHISPYAYCAGNPINAIDPDGCDTVNVIFQDNKWIFSDVINSEGDDVFNVTQGGETATYTFSDGEYGERLNVLNLEGGNNETFGVYHVSGTNMVGYVIQPHGPATTEIDGSRIQDGNYSTFLGEGVQWPKYVGVKNSKLFKGNGARIHYGTDSSWSSACLLLSYDYYMKGRIHKFDLNLSRDAVAGFNYYMGATKRIKDVRTPGINNNPRRKIDRYEWGKINKLGKVKLNILTR